MVYFSLSFFMKMLQILLFCCGRALGSQGRTYVFLEEETGYTRQHRGSPISQGISVEQEVSEPSFSIPEPWSADPAAVLTFPSPYSCTLETSLFPRPRKQGSGFMNTVFVLRGSRCTEGLHRNNKYHSGFPWDPGTVVSLFKEMWTERPSPGLPSPTSGHLSSQDVNHLEKAKVKHLEGEISQHTKKRKANVKGLGL